MPWSNEACAPRLPSLCSAAREPQLPRLVHPKARAPPQEKPPQWESSPHSPRLEKSPHSSEDASQPKLNKFFKIKKKERYKNTPKSYYVLHKCVALRGMGMCRYLFTQSRVLANSWSRRILRHLSGLCLNLYTMHNQNVYHEDYTVSLLRVGRFGFSSYKSSTLWDSPWLNNALLSLVSQPLRIC